MGSKNQKKTADMRLYKRLKKREARQRELSEEFPFLYGNTQDMIRAMSDEELSEIFCVADWCNVCGQLKQDGTCHAIEMGGPLNPYCKAGCLTWLRKPAGEE